MDDLFTTTDAAKVLKISKAALVRFRRVRQGPPFAKVGRLVRYSRDDLQEWLRSRRVEPVQVAQK